MTSQSPPLDELARAGLLRKEVRTIACPNCGPHPLPGALPQER